MSHPQLDSDGKIPLRYLKGHVYPVEGSFVSGAGTAGADATAQTVVTIPLPKDTITQLGDRLRIRCYWRGDTGGGAVTGSVSIGPAAAEILVSNQTDSGGASFFMNEAWLHYIDNTHANIIEHEAGALGAVSAANIAGFTWNADQVCIVAQDNAVLNHIVVFFLGIDIYPKGV